MDLEEAKMPQLIPKASPKTSCHPAVYPAHLRIGLMALKHHFRDPNMMNPSLFEYLDSSIYKRMMTKSATDVQVRHTLGSDSKLWKDFLSLFYEAINSISDRCFAPKNAHTKIISDSASSSLIATNHASLQYDLTRLYWVIGIARNILETGAVAQDLAAFHMVDRAIFKLITICIKVTARGFDPGTDADEEKWQKVINDFKRILIDCLKFLNNLIAGNKKRAVGLCQDLFATNSEAVDELVRQSRNDSTPPNLKIPPHPSKVYLGMQARTLACLRQASPFQLYLSNACRDAVSYLLNQGKMPTIFDIELELRVVWDQADREFWAKWTAICKQIEEISESKTNAERATKQDASVIKSENSEARQQTSQTVAEGSKACVTAASANPKSEGTENARWISFVQKAPEIGERGLLQLPPLTTIPDTKTFYKGELTNPANEEDMKMTVTPETAEELLEKTKGELRRQHEFDNGKTLGHSVEEKHSKVLAKPTAPGNGPPHPPEGIPATVSDDDNSDYDYDIIPGDERRGLLTDVPLILGPNEIDILPMIVQTMLYAPPAGRDSKEHMISKLYPAICCHQLLQKEYGRNLLRELLIFVAAWDLREEELYFKFMVSIMEKTLLNGLMPFAYDVFRESKDIISPAQAVIMKLLTSIFRSRQNSNQPPNCFRSAAATEGTKAETDSSDKEQLQIDPYPLCADAKVVTFLMIEFRKVIIPRVCALINFQGRVHQGLCTTDDFPLNLWDMERMYEGTYQFLEFFAILTDHKAWKSMMTTWNLVHELITLLDELDLAIPRTSPKNDATTAGARAGGNDKSDKPGASGPTSQRSTTASTTPLVERPYDLTDPPSASKPSAASASVSDPPSPSSPSAGRAAIYANPNDEEPSDFEWRNLKKIAVLVISSLVWKAPDVQAQLGAPDRSGKPGRGIRVLLRCCSPDDFNPYIREHAIMALRFALEGCEANQRIVRDLGEALKKAGSAAAGAGDSAGGEGPAVGGAEKKSAKGKGKAKAVPAHEGSSVLAQAAADAVEVPKEVLDLNGYVTFVDESGQVELRRRDEEGVAMPLRDGDARSGREG